MEAFIATLNALKNKNILIHCGSNVRVSFMLGAYYQITTGKINANAMRPELDIQGVIKKHPEHGKYLAEIEKHYNIKIVR